VGEFVFLLFGSAFACLTVLRILRLCRLGRAARVMLMVPELHAMVKNLASAVRVTMWGSVFIAIIILVWSVLAVQLLHPINVEISKTGIHEDCPRCQHAYDSVWHSAISLTQHMIAGDAWGQVNLPIIEKAPWTILIFVSMLFSAQLYIMNLVLAVIVQCANVEIEEEKKLKEQTARLEVAAAQAKLLTSLSRIDHDSSGTISKIELVASTKNDPDIASQMSALGVERHDVGTVFDLMDTSGYGEVSYKELVTSLHRLQSHDQLQCTIVTLQQFSRLHERLLDSLRVDLCGAGDEVEKKKCPNEQGPVDTAAPVGLKGMRIQRELL